MITEQYEPETRFDSSFHLTYVAKDDTRNIKFWSAVNKLLQKNIGISQFAKIAYLVITTTIRSLIPKIKEFARK